MAMPRIEITGTAGLIELLQTLPEKQLLPAIAKGLRDVGSKTTRDARKRLTKGHGLDTGATKRSLGVRKVVTIKKELKVICYMGTRRGHALIHPRSKRKHDPFFIAHLVEKKYQMLKLAVEANKGEFNKQMIEKISTAITKARASGK